MAPANGSDSARACGIAPQLKFSTSIPSATASSSAFSAIVRWVETSYFAGIAVGKAGFDACRQAYVAFVAAEGIA